MGSPANRTMNLAASHATARFGRALLGVLILAALSALAWWIVRTAVADQLALTAPQAALKVAPTNVNALVNAAEADIGRKPPALSTASARLRVAVTAAPVEARIYSDLGVVAVLQGDLRRADRLFAIATRLSRRQLPAETWRFADEIQQGEYPAAWATMDVILRTAPGDISARFAPIIASALAHPGALPAFSAVLASNPPWRGGLLAELSRQSGARGLMVAALAALRDTHHPAATEEVAGVLRGEIDARDYARAFNDWRSLLPSARTASRSAIYNGRFVVGAGEVPFDWTIASDAAGVVSLGEGADGTGLRVVPLDRNAKSPLMSELLALPAGGYRLGGEVRIPGVTGSQSDGFAWSMRCAETGQIIGQTGTTRAGERWTAFNVLVSVPTERCSGQWLDLMRRATLDDTSTSAPVLYDRLTLVSGQ